MGLPQFESCCFCIPLRIGTLILGYLFLIVSLLGIILSTLVVVPGAVMTSFTVGLREKDMHENDLRLSNNGLSNDQVIKLAGAVAVGILAVSIVFLLLFIIHFIFVIYLLVGGHNENPAYIKPYLVYSVVMLPIAVILTIVKLIVAPSAAVVFHFVAYAIQIYFLLVIHSYMIKLQENPEGDRAGRVYKPVDDAAP